MQTMTTRPAETLAAPASLVASATAYAADARSENTRKAYTSDLGAFAAFCRDLGAASLPAESATVALYVAHLADAGRAPATIDRALASISQAHKLAGLASPTSDGRVREVVKGVKRTVGTAQDKAAPATADVMRAWLDTLGTAGLRNLRDRAMLLLGYAGALRRSELVELQVADVEPEAGGFWIVIRRSKTDQAGETRRVPIHEGLVPALCPVRALTTWLSAAGIATGPLFRAVTRGGLVAADGLQAVEVDRLVKRVTVAAGMDAGRYSAHSLRAGHATQAERNGVPMSAWMAAGGWRSTRIALGYVRAAATLQATDSSARIGL